MNTETTDAVVPPETPMAKCNPPATLPPTKQESEQAIRIYSEFLDLDGDDLAALSGLFYISRRTGQTKEIKYYLRQYLLRHPRDTEIMHCLASIFIMEEKLDVAREVLLDILDIDSDNANAKDLIEELDYIKAQKILENAREMWLIKPA